jgi:hypothetical protein
MMMSNNNNRSIMLFMAELLAMMFVVDASLFPRGEEPPRYLLRTGGTRELNGDSGSGSK